MYVYKLGVVGKDGEGSGMALMNSLQSQISLQMTWKRRLYALNLEAKEFILQLRMHEQDKKLKQVLIVSFIPYSSLVHRFMSSAAKFILAEVAGFTCLSHAGGVVNQHWHHY